MLLLYPFLETMKILLDVDLALDSPPLELETVAPRRDSFLVRGVRGWRVRGWRVRGRGPRHGPMEAGGERREGRALSPDGVQPALQMAGTV